MLYCMSLSLSLKERAELYTKTYPQRSPLYIQNNCIEGLWKMGRNYAGSGYHGAYPASYLPRINCLFPDAKNVLHLFSGSLPKGGYTRFDLNGRGEIKGEAHCLSEYFRGKEPFDLIIADPPYAKEDCLHYGVPVIRRQKVITEAFKILEPGGILIWLDQVWPNYSKKICSLIATIGLLVSTNHRCRMCFAYRKL